MPEDLKDKKGRLQRLTADEEAAWASRDYERAATFKAERLKLEQEFTVERTAWRAETGLDEVVSEEDIAHVVASWTGIPPVSYTHLRAHETVLDLVCRLLLEKKKTHTESNNTYALNIAHRTQSSKHTHD
mgnify:CR=1 FL=1